MVDLAKKYQLDRSYMPVVLLLILLQSACRTNQKSQLSGVVIANTTLFHGTNQDFDGQDLIPPAWFGEGDEQLSLRVSAGLTITEGSQLPAIINVYKYQTAPDVSLNLYETPYDYATLYRKFLNTDGNRIKEIAENLNISTEELINISPREKASIMLQYLNETEGEIFDGIKAKHVVSGEPEIILGSLEKISYDSRKSYGLFSKGRRGMYIIDNPSDPSEIPLSDFRQENVTSNSRGRGKTINM